MKISELIDRVKSLYNEKNIAQESKVLSNRHIYNKLTTSRAKILSQELDKHKFISQDCYQSLLISLSYSNMLYDNNTNILRSNNKIPSIITERNKPVIQNVTNINGTVNIYNSFDGGKYVSYNKYTGKALYYYLKDSYLYIVGSDSLNSVVLNAVFLNPLDIQESVPFLERTFPIDGTLIDNLISLTFSELIVAAKVDNENNTK